jgi:hypothetical protein
MKISFAEQLVGDMNVSLARKGHFYTGNVEILSCARTDCVRPRVSITYNSGYRFTSLEFLDFII